MKKNAEGMVVCEKCEKAFEVDDQIVFRTDITSRWHFDHQRVLSEALVQIRSRDLMVYHLECSADGQSALTPDTLKEVLTNLDPKVQRKVYLYMHDALGMRI